MKIYKVSFTLSTGFGTNSHIEVEADSPPDALRIVNRWITQGEFIGLTRDRLADRTARSDRGVIFNPAHVVGLFVDLD